MNADSGVPLKSVKVDGGWIVDYAPSHPAGSLDWRGHATVRAIDILRRNARI